MEKKLYFLFSDGADVCGIAMFLEGCMEWIKGDIEEMQVADEERVYELKTVWLTDKEFGELPEANI